MYIRFSFFHFYDPEWVLSHYKCKLLIRLGWEIRGQLIPFFIFELFRFKNFSYAVHVRILWDYGNEIAMWHESMLRMGLLSLKMISSKSKFIEIG